MKIMIFGNSSFKRNIELLINGYIILAFMINGLVDSEAQQGGVFVEIGVQNGGSIQMWKDYFGKDVKLIGIDIDERCKQFEDDQVTIEIGSQEDIEFWNYFKNKYPRVDILLDDGGHSMKQQITTFKCMFPHIQDGGIYMCEDTHTSYWSYPEYKSADEIANKNSKNNYMEFMKTLVDEINAFHAMGTVPITDNTLNMGGIHFYDSIVVIEKEFRILRPIDLKLGDEASVNDEEMINF